MKTNELRIGNLIYYHDKTITVAGVVNSVIYYNYGNCFDGKIGEYEPFQPIPLTKEWLLMLGFKYNRTNDLGKEYSKTMDDGFLFYIELRCHYACYITGENNNGDWDIIAKIQYVHQLQNLYFTLTGNELKIEI